MHASFPAEASFCAASYATSSAGLEKHIVAPPSGRPEDVIIRVAAKARRKSRPDRRPTDGRSEAAGRAKTRRADGVEARPANPHPTPATTEARVPRPDQVAHFPAHHTTRPESEGRVHLARHQIGPTHIGIDQPTPACIFASS
jgi:hypothetical protein